jgi:hypothetical protein
VDSPARAWADELEPRGGLIGHHVSLFRLRADVSGIVSARHAGVSEAVRDVRLRDASPSLFKRPNDGQRSAAELAALRRQPTAYCAAHGTQGTSRQNHRRDGRHNEVVYQRDCRPRAR